MSYQIFLVEDHPAMCTAYVQILEREPELELCGVAETAEEGLDRLRGTPCDLVLTDLSLPGMDGFALAERIRSERPDLPVVIVSAHQDAGYEARARQAGARAYLTKDHIARRLGPALLRVLREPADARPAPPDEAAGP